MKRQHSVLVIKTGGTFSGHSVSTFRKENNDITIANSLDKSIIKHIEHEAGCHIKITQYDFFNIDSSDICQFHWSKIIEFLCKNYDNHDSFILTHGTNTIGYSAAALSFALTNFGKPVILTGSQIPYGMPGSDAKMNLVNSIRVSIRFGVMSLAGVIVVFGNQIIPGTRVKKTTEFDYDALTTFLSPSLGRVGREIELVTARVQKHSGYLQPLAVNEKQLRVQASFDTRIVSLTEFPGMNWKLFEALVDSKNVRGIVFRAFGAGDPSKELMSGFQYLKEKGIPVVVTTQASHGISSFRVNDSGFLLRLRKMAIPAWDMSIESQTVKLSWLLANSQNTYKIICSEMVRDLRGELHNIQS